MLPKISVIVPVYNVDHYLEPCVSSIVNQLYTNLEIILVDDGSTDRSSLICDSWMKIDSRIQVIHKNNGGLSEARNVGLSIASGDLIGFVDGDDWISPNMFSLLYENMIETGSDIASCGIELVWEGIAETYRLTKEGCCVLNKRAAMEAIISESWLKQPVWNKLYKAETLKNVKFVLGKTHEDVFWSYQVINNADKVSVIDTPCYHYVQRRGSIMNRSYSLKNLDALDAKVERTNFIEKYYPELFQLSRNDLWFSCIYSGQRLLANGNASDRENGFKKIKDILVRYPIEFKGNSQSIDQRIWLFTTCTSIKLTCKIRNWLRIGC